MQSEAESDHLGHHGIHSVIIVLAVYCRSGPGDFFFLDEVLELNVNTCGSKFNCMHVTAHAPTVCKTYTCTFSR